MIKCFVVALAFFSFVLAGCEQQPPTPSSGQPSSSPTPAPSTAPTTPAGSPEASATPVPTVTPETTPAASPSSTATPETTPTPSPAATPDGAAPSPSSSPSASESDVRPTLSSRSANEYLQSYDDYITDFKSASKAMKEGDMTKYQSVIQRAHELRTKSEKLGGELTPEEEQRFANYLNKKANELAQFASQNR
jgi:hypothetical protein